MNGQHDSVARESVGSENRRRGYGWIELRMSVVFNGFIAHLDSLFTSFPTGSKRMSTPVARGTLTNVGVKV